MLSVITLVASRYRMCFVLHIHREFTAVEVEAYNRLNSIEPVIVPDEVILQTVLCCEFAIYYTITGVAR